MDTVSFNLPINLNKGEKGPLALTNFEANGSVFFITDQDNSFPYTAPGH